MKDKFKEIIERELPGFWYKFSDFRFLSEDVTVIRIAPVDYLINNVENQRPQDAKLTYSRGELQGSASIYREPDPTHPTERHLVMAGVYVKVRKHKPGKECEALTKFCRKYREALKTTPNLLYGDVVPYERLLA